MQIDRAKFLVLSASLAGCVSNAPLANSTSGGNAPPVPEGSTTTPLASASADPGPPVAPPPPTGEGYGPSGEGYVPMGEGYPAKEGYPAGEGYPSPDPSLKKLGVPVGTWKCGAGGDDTSGAIKCVAKGPDCSWAVDSCKGAGKYFKPKIAERATSCINQIGSNCSSTYECRKAALRSACPDATVDAACQQAMSTCKKVKLHECRTWMTGLNAAGRSEAIKCLANPTYCGFGIYSCVEGLG